MYARVYSNNILCRYLLDPLALLDLIVSLMSTFLKGGALRLFTVSQLRMIGGPSAQRFIATSSVCSYAMGATSSRVMQSGLPAITCVR